MTPGLATLLAAEATTVVSAAAADARSLARAGFRRLLGRGDARWESVAIVRLGALAAAIEQVPVEELATHPEATRVPHNTARDHGQVFASLGGNVTVPRTPPVDE